MYEKILVAVDGSPTSDRALAEAVQLAKLTGSRLRLVNVVEDLTFAMALDGYSAIYTGDLLQQLSDAGQQILDRARATVEAAGVEVDTTLLQGLAGRVSDLVVDEAGRWEADLIVVGTHGRRGVRRLVLGSDAEQILRTASVPVLLVRDAGDSVTTT